MRKLVDWICFDLDGPIFENNYDVFRSPGPTLFALNILRIQQGSQM